MDDLIVWDDTYDLEVGVIDDQHKKMIGIINELYHAIRNSTERENLPDIITELTEYADYHFITEEKFFVEFNYKDKEAHMASHQAYRQKIADFLRDYHNDETILPINMMRFLSEWWSGHIRGEDRGYVELFHKNGLK